MKRIVSGIVIRAVIILLGIVFGIISVHQQEKNRAVAAELRKQYQPPQVILPEEPELDITPVKKSFPVNNDKREEEDLLIERVVQAEAGGEPLVGKIAVAATILNRMECRGMTVEEVVYEINQYASPTKGPVSNETQEAVRIAREYRDLYPRNMVYFRTDHYHDFGKEYTIVGSHYFSVEPLYDTKERETKFETVLNVNKEVQ